MLSENILEDGLIVNSSGTIERSPAFNLEPKRALSPSVLSNDDLVFRFTKLVQTERKITHLVLECIAEIDSARLLREIPVVSEKIEAGALNLSQLSQVQRAVRATEKMEARRMATSEKVSILGKIEFASQEHRIIVINQ